MGTSMVISQLDRINSKITVYWGMSTVQIENNLNSGELINLYPRRCCRITLIAEAQTKTVDSQLRVFHCFSAAYMNISRLLKNEV